MPYYIKNITDGILFCLQRNFFTLMKKKQLTFEYFFIIIATVLLTLFVDFKSFRISQMAYLCFKI